MHEWLKCFSEEKNPTLRLNGKTFSKQQFLKKGSGSHKRVYKHHDQGFCFFIPNKWSSEQGWVSLITSEKMLLDEILSLGLKAQQFEIADLTIISEAGKSFTIKVLVTKDFETLAKDESIVIYNGKGDERVIGACPPFHALKECFKDPAVAQQMLNIIINEYAIAMAFELPISAIKCLDDSEHFCFELPPPDSKALPVARYMFWDVVGDFSGVTLPRVPTLENLKSGYDKDSSISPINMLANGVVIAMGRIAGEEIKNAGVSDFDYYMEVYKDIKLALNDDAFLNKALACARQVAVNFLKKKLKQPEINTLILQNNKVLLTMIISAITTDDLDLVKHIVELHPRPAAFIKEYSAMMLEVANQYKHQPIIEYLSHVPLEVKLVAKQDGSVKLIIEAMQDAKGQAAQKTLSNMEEKTNPVMEHPAYHQMIETIRVLQEYVNAQTTRLSLRKNDCFNKGIFDKHRLFELVGERLTKMQAEFTNPAIDVSKLAQDLEKCIADCGTIAHHHRRSKLDRCANFFIACIPTAEPIIPLSWKEWQQLDAKLLRAAGSQGREDQLYQAYASSLNEKTRLKDQYNHYRHQTFRH